MGWPLLHDGYTPARVIVCNATDNPDGPSSHQRYLWDWTLRQSQKMQQGMLAKGQGGSLSSGRADETKRRRSA